MATYSTAKYLFFSHDVFPQFYFAERSFPNGFSNSVLADLHR